MGSACLASAVCALAGIYWFDLGMIGFSIAIAGGFCLFAALECGWGCGNLRGEHASARFRA